MRLIDADALKDSFSLNSPIHISERLTVLGAIAKAPTIEVEPICRGQWVEEVGMFMCSKCWDAWGTENEEMIKDFNYCPNCGAKMEKRK